MPGSSKTWSFSRRCWIGSRIRRPEMPVAFPGGRDGSSFGVGVARFDYVQRGCRIRNEDWRSLGPSVPRSHAKAKPKTKSVGPHSVRFWQLMEGRSSISLGVSPEDLPVPKSPGAAILVFRNSDQRTRCSSPPQRSCRMPWKC